MKRITSFKAQYRQPPARAATPPSPAWEPLSPVLPAPAPSAAHPARSLPPYSLPLGSPIEALADAAVSSQRHFPAYGELSRRASHTATSPRATLQPTSERAPKHAFARDAAHAYNERPAKRARSEYHTSPPYGQHQSRPATSHISGYNVEQMMDSGMRMYQDNRAAAPPQSNGGDKMLSDAELLLFFSNVSAHTAQTPPSTAKRWSVSQASPAELPPQQTPHIHAPTSPYVATMHIPSSQHQRLQDPSDAKASSELPSLPPVVPDTASASQTQTPPEETMHMASEPPAPEAGPAEEGKHKKQPGVPKSKARGSRSTPSTGKRKRSTPKPKAASSASVSAGSDQLQSPQSLPVEQPLPTTNNDTPSEPLRVEQSHPTSPHNRRHSFSTSISQLPSNAAQPTSFRAQSAPLGGEPVIPIPAAILSQPAKKAALEQPELICAACKSSDSEVKVGDGEQWIGCDGCKEWYHYACAGFSSEREVRDVNKFYCDPCRPKFGETTSRSTDATRRYNSNLAQRFASPSESTRQLTTPVSMKVSSRRPTTTPSITTSPLSRMEI
jgi:F-box/leucine-rich repeat protein 10/11